MNELKRDRADNAVLLLTSTTLKRNPEFLFDLAYLHKPKPASETGFES
jgi:hypothetical protein